MGSSTGRPYGDWCPRADPHTSSPDDIIDDLVGRGLPEWRERVITSGALTRMKNSYRDAIDAALPPDVGLCGDTFYGPATPAPGEFDGYPTNEFGALDFQAILADVDPNDFIEQHDPDA